VVSLIGWVRLAGWDCHWGTGVFLERRSLPIAHVHHKMFRLSRQPVDATHCTANAASGTWDIWMQTLGGMSADSVATREIHRPNHRALSAPDPISVEPFVERFCARGYWNRNSAQKIFVSEVVAL
jgi:hypothetical protein